MVRWLLLSFLFAASSAFANAPTRALIKEQERALFSHEGSSVAPGAAVLVAIGDDVVFRQARGLASVELGVALTADQVFRIGSITKMLTATTVLKLVAAKKLSLADPLSKFLPGFPNGGNITISQLLDHTAGVSDAIDANPASSITASQLVKAIAAAPADFPPGSDWRYSNSGYQLLGAIIENVTGQPWNVAVKNLVLDPAGMTRTGYIADQEIAKGRVDGYSVDPEGAAVRAPFISMTGPGAAGALSSTVDDLFHFMRQLTHARLLPADLYARMTAPGHTLDGHVVEYGYGVMLGTVRGEPVIEHNGGIDGFASHMSYFPNQDVTVVVLANIDAGSPNPRSLAHRLGAVAGGKPYRSYEDSALDASELAGLAGCYQISASSTHVLSLEGEALFVQRDAGPKRRLATAKDDVLYFPGDRTDYFQVVRDRKHRAVALDFYSDGMPPARHEVRLK